jgi:hypothetical protein
MQGLTETQSTVDSRIRSRSEPPSVMSAAAKNGDWAKNGDVSLKSSSVERG